MKKKTLWILSMVALCLVLYTIVLSRMENSATIIFGGTEGGFVRTDGINFADTNVTPEPEPTEDIWPKLTTKDFEDNTYLQIVNNNNLLSSAYEPEVSKIERTRYMMYSTEYMPYLDAFLDAIEEAGFTTIRPVFDSFTQDDLMNEAYQTWIAVDRAFSGLDTVGYSSSVPRFGKRREELLEEDDSQTIEIYVHPIVEDGKLVDNFTGGMLLEDNIAQLDGFERTSYFELAV